MKCSLGISNFLEEISSLPHSIFSLYFFAFITEKGFLISPCYSLELCIQMGISSLFSFVIMLLIHNYSNSIQRYSVFSSVTQLYLTLSLCDPMNCSTPASLFITNSQSLLKLMSVESVMTSNHLIPCRPLLILPSIFPSIRVFSNESALHFRWTKYWSFSFNISPSNEHPGLISFRMDSLAPLAVRGSLESSLTPQFQSINSLALSFLYSPTLTSIHDYWKYHCLD